MEIMSQSPRVFLCGITTSGKAANLFALIEPVSDYITGLQWTFHHPTDKGADYLEARKGQGRIVYAHYHRRHGASMTQYLHQGTMKDGDYFIQVDDLERISPAFFTEKLPGFIALMEETGVAMVANYGKGLLFRYNEQLEFRGSPHWYATGLDGQAINVELEKKYFWNVRAEQRPRFHWVGHYLFYWLFPAGSNSALLGLEKQGDPQQLFPLRESKRLAFREEVVKRGFELTVDGVKAMWSAPLDEKMKSMINSEKTLNDAYRYLVLGDEAVVDTHSPKDMKIIQ